ncbi:hypothetical protein HAX54_047302 [Datura stramonium]|uniref:Uncharacterized protein n=1 Tax=Datura stramonium TaxID=4076 RepID=A0ABS8WJY1_DATST|nr:hypothetical protein [Datura stramonium]
MSAPTTKADLVVAFELPSTSHFSPLYRGSPTNPIQKDTMSNSESPKKFEKILTRNMAPVKLHIEPISMRPIEVVNEVPVIKWTEEENLHPEWRTLREEVNTKSTEKAIVNHTFPPRMLASGKLVGDLNTWTMIKDNRVFIKEKKENRNKSHEGSRINKKGKSTVRWGTMVEEEQEAAEENTFEEDIQRKVMEIVIQ